MVDGPKRCVECGEAACVCPRFEPFSWRKKERQTRLVPVSRRILSEEEKEFNAEKIRLRSVYKRLKVGLCSWKDVSANDKRLLQKYYGVGE